MIKQKSFSRQVPFLLLAFLPLPALAQEQPDSSAPVLLPGLTVTVLRAPYEALRAPFAVGVTGQEQIQRARPGLALDEALRTIPGVQVDNRYNYALGERLSIRGFGARAQFGIRGVRVVVDGVPATFPDGQTSLSHVDMSFLSRAEVVRGPASALYGSSAGGVVQLETEEPPLVPYAQDASVTAGSDGLLKVHATGGGTRGPLSYLLNLSRLEYGGYREFSGAENLQLQSKLGYRGERDEVRLSLSAVRYDADNPGSLSQALLDADRTQAFRNNVLARTGEEGSQQQLGVAWTRQAAGGELEVAGYGIARGVDNPIPASIIDLERRVGGVRAAFRRIAGFSPLGLRWSAGVDADLQRDDRRNFANQSGERGTLTLSQGERVTNLAGFAQLSASAGSRLGLLGGLRYDWFRFSADDRLVSADNPDDSGSRVMDAVSPSFGVTYSFGELLNLYGNAATAFETPTTTELANRPSGAGGFNPELEPQTALSFEIGGKGRRGRVAYELALYRSAVENELIAFEIPSSPGRQFFRNAGSATHRGVEAGATVAPLRHALVRAAYTFTDARFDEYVAAGNAFDGNRLPGISPHRAELLLSYGAPAGPFAALETRYASRTPVDDANGFHSPSYVVTDLRAGLDGIRLGRLRLDPFAGITNLLDEEYNTSVVVNAFGRRYFEPGPGRAFYFGSAARVGR